MARRNYLTSITCTELEKLFDIEREMEQYSQEVAIEPPNEDTIDLVDWLNTCDIN